jgi:hypothetical protein
MRKLVFVVAAAAVCAGALAPLVAQQPPRAMTAADYARAEKFMTYNVTPLVYRSGVCGNWLADDRFWYRVTTPGGSEVTLVDPAKATKVPCELPECAAGAGRRSCAWTRRTV